MTRIIHITDLHFWQLVKNPLLLFNKRILGNLNLLARRRRHVRQERAASFVELFNTLGAHALLIGGDLTTTATNAEYEMAVEFVNALARSGAPVYMTAGNHDMYTFESRRRRRFEKHFGDRLDDADKPRLSYLPGGAPLLILPTAAPNMLTSRGHITTAQMLEARRLIEEAPEGRLVVLAHYPVLPNPTAFHYGVTRPLFSSRRVRRILGDANRPILYLAGHVHVFSRTVDPRFPNLEQITTSALFYQKRHFPGGFT
ncbi:MAG TPA: metallophosphoesterase, partial [Candidatus Hydrogenedentes bacterium]|nr:metallophosphoesterase [Candidatus Hydrogenedentota bacterium]